jgi:serine/threonine protein kinase
MAPESLKTREYSSKSDVWSFGVLCAEIFNRGEPYSPALTLMEIAFAVHSGDLRPSSARAPPVVKEIIDMCSQYLAKA